MKSMPASSAMRTSLRLSGQLPDQRSGTRVTARPEEQFAPNKPILSLLALYIDRRSACADALRASTLSPLSQSGRTFRRQIQTQHNRSAAPIERHARHAAIDGLPAQRRSGEDAHQESIAGGCLERRSAASPRSHCLTVLGCWHAAAQAAQRPTPGISQPRRPHRRALPGRRPGRHRRAGDRPEDERGLGPAGRDREPAGRQHRDRRAGRREGAARRLHAVHGDRLDAGDEPVSLQEPALRPAQ